MPVPVFPTIGGDPLAAPFELDAHTSETQEDAVTWTSVPVEGTGNVSEHGADEPRVWTFTGMVGAGDPNHLLPRDKERMNRQHDALLVLKKARQLVTVVGSTFVANAGIARVTATRSADQGDVLGIEIELKEIFLPIPTTTTIPASRLRASVRRRASAGRKGGAGAASVGGNAVAAKDGELGLGKGKDKYAPQLGAGN